MAERSLAPIEVSTAAYGTYEARALTTASGTASTLLPTDFYGRVIERLLDESGVMAAGATLITSPDGAPLSIPRATSYPTSTWVSEGASIASSDPGLSTVTLSPHKLGFITICTNEVLTDAGFDVAAFLARAAGVSIGQVLGPALVTGASWQNNARGFTIDTQAASVTGASAVSGAMTADNLIDVMYALGDGYLRANTCGWLMSKTALKMIRRLKASGTGDYVFSD